jgi:hypothetical protein
MQERLYEAFDNFLEVGTWHTRHPSDEGRFFVVLHTVVKDPRFNPDQLGEYIRQKKKISRDDENLLNVAVDQYVAAAWAVKDYLKANGL